MLIARPSSFLSADSESLYNNNTPIPSIPSIPFTHSAPLTPSVPKALFEPGPRLVLQEHLSERARPSHRTSKLARSTRPRLQRRSRNILRSTSNEIFGHWDIRIKGEARLHSKVKGKVGVNRGAQGTVSAMGASEAAEASNIRISTTSPSSTSSAPREHASESHKTGLPVFKTLRRMPSAFNPANNATTAWTVGQQKSHGKDHAASPSAAAGAPSSTANKSSNDSAEASPSDPFSARSKFLKAFGKFKNRHLSHKRSNIAGTGGALSVTNNNSDSGNSTNTNNRMSISASLASSFILPPIQLDHELSMTSADQGSSAIHGHSDTASISMRSYVEPTIQQGDTEQLQFQDIDMEDSEARRTLPQGDRSAPSSSLVKFKNRVHNTLASIKSSSNLREKARSQQTSLSAPDSTPVSAPISTPISTYNLESSPSFPTSASAQPQQLQSSSRSITSEPQQTNPMLRLSKPFWTHPRVRPESNSPSKLMLWGNKSRSSSLVDSSPCSKTQHVNLDAVMISPELGPQQQQQQQQPAHDTADELDSDDDSIDFIMPGDYSDYTQFAELPLKKRKKLQAAAAAASAYAATQDPSNKRPNAVKRFLLPQKTASDKDKTKAKENNQAVKAQSSDAVDAGTFTDQTIPQRNSKKRPKDQDSIEQQQRQEANEMGRSSSGEPSEWRKAIMKSLHLGRATKKLKNMPSAEQSPVGSPIETKAPSLDLVKTHEPSLQPSQRDSGVYSGDLSSRPKRSESISSVRSRSMGTSTHPALLATTVSPPRNPSTRRETLEMAMRRRRRSSAAHSIFVNPPAHLGLPSAQNYFDDDAASTHVTHTFTSFTLEVADLDHAHAIVNNSVVPGLFNFKRQPRLTVSSMQQLDTDQDFKGFDSDGDAMSGYTGDADVSMEEIFVRPRTPTGSKADKGKGRDSGSREMSPRRKMSIGDADSDTLPELPALSIRTKDVSRSSSGGRIAGSHTRSVENSNREGPRTLRRAGPSLSPTLHRKASRNILNGSPVTINVSPATTTSSSPPRNSPAQFSADDSNSWKPRNVLQQTRPSVPALNTKFLSNTRGTAHQRQPSSAHQQQTSSDTLLPHHLKNFSTGSTLSASSNYSAQTLNGGSPITPISFHPKEFDASQEFPPNTPVDLKAMDFDTLLRTAEREQQKGQEERTLKKKKSFQFQNPKPLKIHMAGSGSRQNVENYSNGFQKTQASPFSAKSALSALVASAPNLDDLRTRGSDASCHSNISQQYSPPGNRSHSSNGGKYGGLQVQTNRPEAPRPPTSLGHARLPISKSAITFELAENAVMASHASRHNPRSRRVMKKKTSVIKLSGNVQGRREDDGMIRVTVAPTVDHRQWRAT